jgi:outer membrane biosynthesis protein TonB
MAAFVAVSLVIHAGLYALFWTEPTLDNVGAETISIEIVLGGETVAGDAVAPAEEASQTPEQMAEVKPDEKAAEQQDPSTQMPQDTPVAERETAPEETTAEETAEAEPEDQTYVAMVETPKAEIPTVLPRETLAEMSALLTPPPERPREVKPVEKPKAKQPVQKRQVAPETPHRRAHASGAAEGAGACADAEADAQRSRRRPLSQ